MARQFIHARLRLILPRQVEGVRLRQMLNVCVRLILRLRGKRGEQ
jgi:hypothetical protein